MQPPYCHFKTGALTVGDWARSSPDLDPSARSANAKSVHVSSTKVRRRLMVFFPVVRSEAVNDIETPRVK
jgi:hypothetical protein